LLPFRIFNNIFVRVSPLFHASYMPRPSLLNFITLITFSEQYIIWTSLLSCFLQPSVTSTLLR
jgi:hypothetical protein